MVFYWPGREKERNEVIRMLKDHFVPLAVDNYLPGSNEERDSMEKIRGGSSNCFVYGTAGGTPLRQGQHAWRPENGAQLQGVLDEFKSLPEAARRPRIEKIPAGAPGKYTPTPPPGGLVANVYAAALVRDEKGNPKRSPKSGGEAGFPSFGEPSGTQRDLFWMKPEECASLIPANPKKGDRYPMPQHLQRRMVEYYVKGWYAQCSQVGMREASITLIVEEASPSGVSLRLEGIGRGGNYPYDESNPKQGWVKGANGCADTSVKDVNCTGADMRLLGFLHWDAKKKAFDRFDVVGLGTGWGTNAEMLYPVAPGKRMAVPTGIAFELVTTDRPQDRVTPFHALPHFGDAYWK